MLQQVGKAGDYYIYIARGIDRYRGIINREMMLKDSVFVFTNCVQIHSWFVGQTFQYCELSLTDYSIMKSGLLKPWSLSPLFNWNSCIIETSANTSSQELLKIVTYLKNHKSIL